MEEYTFGGLVSGYKHKENVSISVHNRPLTLQPILVTRIYCTTPDVVTTEMPEDEDVENTTAVHIEENVTNESYDIANETDNRGRNGKINEAFDSPVFNENLIALAVEEEKSGHNIITQQFPYI